MLEVLHTKVFMQVLGILIVYILCAWVGDRGVDMESLKGLKEHGESLGYEGEELRKFVREQQAIEREERAVSRRKGKEERDHALDL